jgi:uncharacterized protein
MKRLAAILGLLGCLHAPAAEVIPPAPARYFNDYANVVSSATADRLNKELEDFERQTSSQIVVAVYPKMQSDSSIEDYAVRVFRAWGVGQRTNNNGALLLVFVQDRKMRIATGYGLEGALPDALCKRILDDEITPRFKAGDYDGGLGAGVTAMIAAAKGEYTGTGRTTNDGPGFFSSIWSLLKVLAIIAFIIFFVIYKAWSWSSWGGWMIGSTLGGNWSNDRGGGSWGGGGGGGGFSGGGGSTGGGGASGSW